MFNELTTYNGIEQRKFKRAYLLYYLRLFDQKTGQLFAHLVNITPDGIMTVSEEPITIGKNHSLRMTLKNAISNKKYVDFEAKSLWSTNDINPDFYDTGFCFTRIDPLDEKIIRDLIHAYEFQD